MSYANVVCSGQPFSATPRCGWKGERFPEVAPYLYENDGIGQKRRRNPEYLDAIGAKPCPKCGGAVVPKESKP
jgi:hypothetical protein